MKICFLELQPFPYSIGGGTFHLIRLSKYLIKKGHEVSIITSKPQGSQKQLETDPKLKIYNVGPPHKVFKKTGILSTIPNLIYRFFWELSWIFSASRKLKEIKPDICNPQSLISTALPCSLTHTPFVSIQHGVYLSGFRNLWKERGSKAVLLLSKIYEREENFNGKRAESIICDGNGSYEYYKKFGKEKCTIITPGIDTEEFSKVRFSSKKDYLFMGRLTEQKGLEYLIDALKILDKEKIKLTLNVAGEGEESYVKPLRDRANSFKNIKVNFLGNILGKEKLDLYNKTKIFISSSIFEPFGIVIAENMASGTAIIASDREGPKLLVKPSFGKLVPFDKKEERARNLAKTIKESLRWNTIKMGKESIKESKKYSYDLIADKTLKVFEKAITKRQKSLS